MTIPPVSRGTVTHPSTSAIGLGSTRGSTRECGAHPETWSGVWVSRV
ncbi:hypothetical protein ACFPRL_16425 [Pseudoclavibacter helvolus]